MCSAAEWRGGPPLQGVCVWAVGRVGRRKRTGKQAARCRHIW